MNEANQKAKELVEKFENILPEIEIYNYDESIRQPQRIAPYNKKDTNKAKQCALIACDEIINSEPMKFVPHQTPAGRVSLPFSNKDFWQSVKQEITKL
jgi:hypothetical protein